MSEPKALAWTPGPWKVVDRSEYRISAGDPRYEIDQASGEERYWVALANNKANVNMLAAAPELYDALADLLWPIEVVCQKGLMSRCKCRTCAEGRARAAMEKARGEAAE